MNNFSEILEAMGFIFLEKYHPNTDYGRGDGYYIVRHQNSDTIYKITFSEDSYGDDVILEKVKQVEAKKVTKVEYV